MNAPTMKLPELVERSTKLADELDAMPGESWELARLRELAELQAATVLLFQWYVEINP